MDTPDVLRQDLATLLRDCAADRRRCLNGGAATGQDLKVIALLERLASDAEAIESGVVSACQTELGEPLAQCFFRHRGDLLAQVGLLYWPKDATDLVRWMTAHLSSPPDRAPDPRFPAASSPRPTIAREDSRVLSTDVAPGQTPARGLVREFTVGLGIVAPLLAIWLAQLAFEQRQNQAALRAHPAVPAVVLSDAPTTGSRSPTPATDVVLAFNPSPSAGPCRVRMRSSAIRFPLTTGQTIMVVPRSLDCEQPLLPAQVGDPLQTFALAIGLLVVGLASLKVGIRLGAGRRYAHSPGRSGPDRNWQTPASRRQGAVTLT